MKRDLEPIEDPIRRALQRLGLTDVDQFFRLAAAWDAVAGEPWAGNTQPLMLRSGELVVEARNVSSVRLLRYATGDLQRRLDDFLGTGRVLTIKVIGPS